MAPPARCAILSSEAVLLTTGCGAHCGKVLIVGQSPTGASQLYTPTI